MVILKRKIIIDGKEVDVPVFQTTIKPGQTVSEDMIDLLQKEEQIEKEIQSIVKKIKESSKKYKKINKNINYFFDVGKILQFVNKKGYEEIRGRIWQRIAHDLAPELLFGKSKTKKFGRSPQTESKRYIEDMYKLAKFSKTVLHKASWSQWDEILKFKDIYKNKKLLILILNECKNGLSGIPLRNKIKELRGILK
jgi:hypothetical protein